MKRILILTSTLLGLAALTACDTDQVVQVVRAVNIAAVPCEGTGTCPTTPPPSTSTPPGPCQEGDPICVRPVPSTSSTTPDPGEGDPCEEGKTCG